MSFISRHGIDASRHQETIPPFNVGNRRRHLGHIMAQADIGRIERLLGNSVVDRTPGMLFAAQTKNTEQSPETANEREVC